MKKIEGFLWLAFTKSGRGFFFGADKHNLSGFESFCTNDLTPFPTREKALTACLALKERKDFVRHELVEIKMEMAETNEECHKLEGKKNLVVLMKGDGGTFLVGRLVSERHHLYPLPGALLADNGFKTFPDFKDALDSAREINRQGAPVTLATFQLKRL